MHGYRARGSESINIQRTDSLNIKSLKRKINE
jgi:hypothetical protein